MRRRLRRAEEALFSAGPAGEEEARRELKALDAELFDALWQAELDGNEPGAAAELRAWRFYRRGLLARLAARGARLDAGRLRALFDGTGSDRLILLVTHACQLRCGYCRVRKYGAAMPPEVAEAGARWLMGSLRRDVELQFFGGEPLLALPVVRRAAEAALRLAERAGKTVRFLLTTNGLALDAEAVAFLRERRFSVEISCDGTMSAQDTQRPLARGGGSWEALSAGLARLRDSGVPYQVIAVLMPEDASRAQERLEALAEAGHRRIQLNYALGRTWTPEQAAALRESLAAAARAARRLGVELVNETARRREPVALNSELTVDCDGTVFRETGVCLEEDFMEMKSRFRAADVRTAGLFDGYGASPFDNLAMLVSSYGEGELRRALRSNLVIGRELAEAR